MKAAVMVERRKPLVIQDVDLVEPGSGEVEIKLIASGVCHSDLHHLQRDTATMPPAVLGHEGAGIVAAVGSNVNRIKVGDQVIIAFGPKCGECYYCLRGQPYLCTPIAAVDIRDNKLEFARDFGATHLINASRDDVLDRVKGLTGGYGADYAFEVIGNPRTIGQAYDSIRKGGTAVVVGVADENAELTIKPVWLMRQSKSLIGCSYGSARPHVDFPRIVDLYMEGKIKLDELITRRYDLDDINEAFRAMDAGEVARSILQLA